MLVKVHQSVVKILSENEILTSIKGHNSVINLQKLMFFNPNLELVKIQQFVPDKILSGNKILM